MQRDQKIGSPDPLTTPAPASVRKRRLRSATLLRKKECYRLTQAINASQPGT